MLLPPIADEGHWRVLASTGQRPVVWATTIRPLADQPGVIASFAVIDTTRLRAALFNGTVLPGGGPWNNGATVMPQAVPALVAAFNGGFRFKHIQGGYFTEGRTVKPLLAGDATFGIRTDGSVLIGRYGRDMTNDGSWVSLRQNLPLVIDGGVDVVATATEPGVARIYWGDDYNHVLLDVRSAICQRKDGSLLYALVGRVDIEGLAHALLVAQCDRAMELDMNGSWPQFVTFGPTGGAQRTPVALDQRMSHLSRVLTTSSTKDFVALFDPVLLPPNVVR